MGVSDSKQEAASKPEVVYKDRVVYQDRVVNREAARPTTPLLTDTPWRKYSMEWTPEYSQKLIAEVKAIGLMCKDAKHPGLLLLGPINAGKSSFINSIFSIGQGRMVNKTGAGSAPRSYTTMYARIRGRGVLDNFRLCDTMGVEDGEEEGFHVSDIIYLIQGHIGAKYKFNPRRPLVSGDGHYEPCPKPEDKIHCVIFVCDATVIFPENVSADMKRKILDLQNKIKDLGVPRTLILTKVDKLCKSVNDDITNIFRSTKVQKVVNKASELFAIPKTNIYPVKNFEEEVQVDALKSIPLLLALRQIMNFASDYSEDDDYTSD